MVTRVQCSDPTRDRFTLFVYFNIFFFRKLCELHGEFTDADALNWRFTVRYDVINTNDIVLSVFVDGLFLSFIIYLVTGPRYY